jgi:hypothetical protein
MAMHEAETDLRPTEFAEGDLLSDLDLLEQRVSEATRALERMRDENRRLVRECEQLREERRVTVTRLGSLIQKVDALRGEP